MTWVVLSVSNKPILWEMNFITEEQLNANSMVANSYVIHLEEDVIAFGQIDARSWSKHYNGELDILINK